MLLFLFLKSSGNFLLEFFHFFSGHRKRQLNFTKNLFIGLCVLIFKNKLIKENNIPFSFDKTGCCVSIVGKASDENVDVGDVNGSFELDMWDNT